MATGPTIPDDVRRFVLTSIPSVPYLEALLLMRANPQQMWDGAQLAQRLYLTEKHASTLLAQLQDARLLEAISGASTHYRYGPDTEGLRDMITQVAALYSTHLVELTNLIHSATGKKAQQFADAFIWRKDS
jgi:hypothetical protein